MLKLDKNKEFLEYEKKFQGDGAGIVKQQEQITEEELKAIRSEFEKNKNSVINKLLEVIGDCKPEIHPNAIPLK